MVVREALDRRRRHAEFQWCCNDCRYRLHRRHGSVLGGGGGISSSTSFSAAQTTTEEGETPVEQNISVAKGIEGGTGATAGDVNLTASGSVTTTGDRSSGIIAQSVGGGGGQAGSASNFAFFGAAPTLAVAIGGKGEQGVLQATFE